MLLLKPKPVLGPVFLVTMDDGVPETSADYCSAILVVWGINPTKRRPSFCD